MAKVSRAEQFSQMASLMQRSVSAQIEHASCCFSASWDGRLTFHLFSARVRHSLGVSVLRRWPKQALASGGEDGPTNGKDASDEVTNAKSRAPTTMEVDIAIMVRSEHK